jgi:tetratricopeptide (TPR) repeat protein
MRKPVTALLILVVLFGAPACDDAQETEWESLNAEVMSLSRKGQYDRAAVVAKKSLEVAERAVGPDHPSVAASLNNLASVYDSQGQYTQAEALYKRALAIWEKALGPDHPNVASTLNNLALLYDNQGRYAQAEPLYRRSLAISEKTLGTGHPDVAATLNNLALLYIGDRLSPCLERKMLVISQPSVDRRAVSFRPRG